MADVIFVQGITREEFFLEVERQHIDLPEGELVFEGEDRVEVLLKVTGQKFNLANPPTLMCPHVYMEPKVKDWKQRDRQRSRKRR